jgi:hypothetical protein
MGVLMKIKRPSLKGMKNCEYLGHFAQDKYIQKGHNFSGRPDLKKSKRRSPDEIIISDDTPPEGQITTSWDKGNKKAKPTSEFKDWDKVYREAKPTFTQLPDGSWEFNSAEENADFERVMEDPSFQEEYDAKYENEAEYRDYLKKLKPKEGSYRVDEPKNYIYDWETTVKNGKRQHRLIRK